MNAHTMGTRSAVLRAALAIAVFVGGVALCLTYGRRGFMALDQSIVFDGGWRLLSGQVPERDFFAPAGLTPIVMQALFFKALGVTWFAYCLHAAVVNGLFALVVFDLLWVLGGSVWIATFYAAASTIYCYTPFGVPYPDQHAFFFSLCAIWALCRAEQSAGMRRSTWLIAIAVFGAAALLSKPVPSGFVIAAIAGWLATQAIRGDWRSFATVAATSALLIAIAMAAGALFALRYDDVRYFVYALPAQEMGWRISNLTNWTGFVGRQQRLLAQMPHTSLWLVALSLPFAGAIGLSAAGRRTGATTRVLPAWLLALLAVAVTQLSAALTNNEPAKELALLPVAVGLAHIAARTTLQAVTTARWAGVLSAAVGVCCVAGVGLEAARFQQTVNTTRAVHAQLWDEHAAPVKLAGALNYLRLNDAWIPHDLPDIVFAIEQKPGNFLLIGDDSVLYGATGRPSVFPVLWMHGNLTLPKPEAPEFAAFAERVVASVNRYDARYAVLEGASSWSGISLSSFPQLEARTTGCPATTVGRWTLVDFCH